MTGEKVYNVRLKHVPGAQPETRERVKREQLERGVYYEEYEASLHVKASSFEEAKERALKAARRRFPQLGTPYNIPNPLWAHEVTTKVADINQILPGEKDDNVQTDSE